MTALRKMVSSNIEDGSRCTNARDISSLVQGFIITTLQAVVFSKAFHRTDCGKEVNIMRCLVSCTARKGGTPSGFPSASTNIQIGISKSVGGYLSGPMKTPSRTKRYATVPHDRFPFCKTSADGINDPKTLPFEPVNLDNSKIT